MEIIDNLNKTMIEEILSEIQISESKYEEAERRYKAIGEWLNRKQSNVSRFNPQIYTQGSFLLGTAIIPIVKQDEYDVDIVCELDLSKNAVSQSALKKMIGDEIIAYAKANNMDYMPSEGKRCWKLQYSVGTPFHIDVLPAIPDMRLFLEFRNDSRVKTDWIRSAIAITDRTDDDFELISQNWPVSNPKGFFQWFKEQMIIQYDKKIRILSGTYRSDVEKLPFYRVRTPLQKVIQLLKFHRNVMFKNDPVYKPISIIISTLAAHAYENEADLVDALVNISAKMRGYVVKDIEGKWLILNPVNPKENFADKWADSESGYILENNFFDWLKRVEKDFSIENLSQDTEPLFESFKHSFGLGVASKALEKVASVKTPSFSKPRPPVEIPPRKPWTNLFI